MAIALLAGEIHIWFAMLDLLGAHLSHFAGLLSPDELERAERYHFERDRRRSIIVHGLLRTILSQYLDTRPELLRFDFGLHGKPALAVGQAGPALHFNLAHSHQAAIYGFARLSHIGIDLEFLRDLPDTEQVAANFFSARENAAWRDLPPEQKTQGFFNCWTRKEAFVKAIGEGLSHPLDAFDVALAPDEPVRFLSIGGTATEASRWSLWSLEPRSGYVAALAAPVPDAQKGNFRLQIFDAHAMWGFGTSSQASPAGGSTPSGPELQLR